MTWAEKAGTFENVSARLQAFEQAIAPLPRARSEGQIALDLLSELEHGSASGAVGYNAAEIRREMAAAHPEALGMFTTQVHLPSVEAKQEADMEVVEL